MRVHVCLNVCMCVCLCMRTRTNLAACAMWFVTGQQGLSQGPAQAGGEPISTNSGPSWLLLFVGCLTSQQHASVSQGWICLDNFTCCHTEKEDADQTFHLTQSLYTDTGPTSPSTDPIIPGAWQGRHWSANF